MREPSKLWVHIENSKWYRKLIQVLKSHNIPGKTNESWYEFISTFVYEWQKADLNTDAAAIAFRFILALPPLLLFFFTLIPYLPLEGLDENLIKVVEMVIPNPEYSTPIINVLHDFMFKEKTGLLSFSLLITIYTSSNGVYSLLQIMDSYSGENLKFRNGFKRRLKALQLNFLFTIELILMLVIMVGQKQFFEKLIQLLHLQKDVSPSFLYYSTYALLFFTTLLTVAIIYFFGPSVEQKWNFFNVGVWFSSLSIMIFTVGLFYIANNFVNYNQIYGSVGFVFLIMIWIFTISKILLIGYTLNHSLDQIRYDNDEE